MTPTFCLLRARKGVFRFVRTQIFPVSFFAQKPEQKGGRLAGRGKGVCWIEDRRLDRFERLIRQGDSFWPLKPLSVCAEPRTAELGPSESAAAVVHRYAPPVCVLSTSFGSESRNLRTPAAESVRAVTGLLFFAQRSCKRMAPAHMNPAGVCCRRPEKHWKACRNGRSVLLVTRLLRRQGLHHWSVLRGGGSKGQQQPLLHANNVRPGPCRSN